MTGESGWYGPSDAVSLLASADPGFSFTGWEGSGTGSYTGPSGRVVLSDIGSPITEVAGFIPLSARFSYTVNFAAASALPPGAQWTIQIGGTLYEGGGGSVSVSGIPYGTYSVTVLNGSALDGLARFVPVTPTFTLVVESNLTQPVEFEVLYWVDVLEAGPGSVDLPSGWLVNGSSRTLTATPESGASFTNWTGSGAGSYSGRSPTASIVVRGPITEVASFLPPPSPQVSLPGSQGLATGSLALIAAAAVATGALIGIVLGRHRRSSVSKPEPEIGHPETSDEFRSPPNGGEA